MPFQKGQSGNPGGKRKGEFRKMMEAALAAAEKKKGISIIQHAVEKAYEDNTVLVAILKKIVPDLKAVEVTEVQKNPFKLIIDLRPKPDAGKAGEKVKPIKPFLRQGAAI